MVIKKAVVKRKSSKYTEAELKARMMGTYCDDTMNQINWSKKQAAYTTEGVYPYFKRLKVSLLVLVRDAENNYNSAYANRIAQIMMDSYLIRKARGENILPPREVVPINAVPDGDKKSTAIEFVDDSQFLDTDKSISENEKIKWVADNMLSPSAKPTDAPSKATWYMLLHYRETKQRQEDFYKTIMPKLLTKENTEQSGKLQDTGKDAIELCERLLKAVKSD